MISNNDAAVFLPHSRWPHPPDDAALKALGEEIKSSANKWGSSLRPKVPADELVQETLIKMMKVKTELPTFQDAVKYAQVVLRNVAYVCVFESQRTDERLLEIVKRKRVKEFADQSEFQVEDCFQTALSEVETNVVYRLVEGYSQVEISKLCGISTSSVSKIVCSLKGKVRMASRLTSEVLE